MTINGKTAITDSVLANRLLEITRRAGSVYLKPQTADTAQTLEDLDAIVSHAEVNCHHGVGVLISRYFREYQNILSIRSRDLYQGEQNFGVANVRLSHEFQQREDVYLKVVTALEGMTVRRILCIPYYPDDVWNALALSDLFGAPLCTYLMDDQNLCEPAIPDPLMSALLSKSRLRLAVSEQLRQGYQQKYGLQFGYMPPLVSIQHIMARPSNACLFDDPVIIGNIWGSHWVTSLRRAVRDSTTTIRWFNNGHFPWLPCSLDDLRADGIHPQTGERNSDEAMIKILRAAPFVIVPSGTMDDEDDRRFIAQMSLPSRIPFVVATSQAPILVLGHPGTAAAKFVTKHGIGISAPYDTGELVAAMERLRNPELNARMRRTGLLLASRFADIGSAEWIWASLSKGAPIDCRFEESVFF